MGFVGGRNLQRLLEGRVVPFTSIPTGLQVKGTRPDGPVPGHAARKAEVYRWGGTLRDALR